MSTALRLTTAEYEQMIASGAFACLNCRIEFIQGELREMTPAGPVHDDIIQFLLTWSAGLVAAGRCKVRSHCGLRVGGSLPEPDFMVLVPKRFGPERPTAKDVWLLVEVAESSLNFDLNDKALLYAAADVTEYWVVDVANQSLHRHLRPGATGYQEISPFESSARLAPQFNSRLELKLPELFAT